MNAGTQIAFGISVHIALDVEEDCLHVTTRAFSK